MTPLATPTDVAHALGLEDENSFTTSQSVRASLLLDKVSSMFRIAAQRVFTSGQLDVRLMVTGGRVQLTETPATIESVTDCDGNSVDYVLDGKTLLVNYPTGVFLDVSYTFDDQVPDAVRVAVAETVARYLTVDPLSAQAQSTDLQAGDFRQRFASWVSSSVQLPGEVLELAKSFRYPGNVVVMRP